MSEQLEIHEFFVEGTDQEISHVLLHIAEPITQIEKQKGYFFALVEIQNSHPNQIADLQQLIEDIETRYYETEAEGEQTFEQILQITNRKSHHILQYKHTYVNCIVGILQDQRLILAYHGKPQATLYYETEHGIKETSIIDVDEENDQLFSAVVEGIVHAQDFIYIATPHVNDYLTTDRIRKIINGRTTRQIAMHVQKVLDNLQNKHSFGGIFFHIPDKPEKIQKNITTHQAQGSKASMDNFINTAKSTEETLSPSLIKNIKESSRDILSNIKGNNKQRIPYSSKVHTVKKARSETNYRRSETNKESLIGKFLIILGTILVFLGKSIYIVTKTILLWITKCIQILFYLGTNHGGNRKRIISDVHHFISDKKNMIANISMFSKIIFIAIIFLIAIFIGSISYLKIKETKQAQEIAYKQTIADIIEKKDEAEARLLYGEEKKALEILGEAKTLIGTLTQDTEEQVTQAQEFSQSIEKILNELRHITYVSPTFITDIHDLNDHAQTNRMIMLNNKLIIFGNEDEYTYEIDPVTSEIITYPHKTFSNFIQADVPKENDGILFLSGTTNLVSFDPDTTAFNKQDISFEDEGISMTDLAIYNRRIYILAAQNDQIYKNNPTQTGYDRGAPWVSKSAVSLTQGIAIAVDGDLYVLTSAGRIVKYYAGEQQGFEVNGLDPALSNPRDLWTYADVNNIYVLESNRIVVIDKEGNFITQYTADGFDNLQAMIITDDEKTAYVLQDNKVYSFEL